MTAGYTRHVSTRSTPQTEKILGREADQGHNRAGGVAFTIDMWSQFARFLVLGQEGSTYYASEKEMVVENAQNLSKCVAEDGVRVVNTIVEYLREGRCPKRDPALFALAYCAKKGNEATRQAANDAVTDIIHIPTDLFIFMNSIKAFGGWGSGTLRGLKNWYLDKDLRQLALHLTKYQSREGWSHRDALRVIHPRGSAGPVRDAMFKYAVSGEVDDVLHADENLDVSGPIIGAEKAKQAENKHEMLDIIKQYRLVRECVPTEYQSDIDVQRMLLRDMPLQAMIRNLGRMGASGLLAPMSEDVKLVCSKLRDTDQLKKARIHPLQVLSALKIYGQGKGGRGNLTWSPVAQVCEALDDCFANSFQFVEPSGARIYIGLDVSGSMTWGNIAGVPGLDPRVASAAMCVTHVRSEENVMVRAFCRTLQDVAINKRTSLADVCSNVDRMSFGGTDCALPMQDARKRKIAIDLFIVYTDNETWAGGEHPSQALQRYRDAMGIDAKLCVVGMTATNFSIADPKDPGMLDVVGFDAAAPKIMMEFARGNL